MILIIGLGNPGKAYSKHRHNIGFQVLDAVAEIKGLHFVEKSMFEALIAEDGDLILVKPTTWMNNSGVAARLLAKQFTATVVAVYDDIDIALGLVKCSFARGAGGHNGVQSLIDHLGTTAFFRIRVGVRPVHPELLPQIAPPDGFEKFLLSNNAPFEDDLKKQGIARALEIIEALKTKSFEDVMNQFN